MYAASHRPRLRMAVLALLLLAWAAVAAATVILLATALLPDHAGFSVALRGWEGRLPDPATFPQMRSPTVALLR